MTIKEVSELTELSQDTLRYYERVGMIPTVVTESYFAEASGGIEFGDGVMLAPGVRIATINYDYNNRHMFYTYGKVTIKKNAWIGLGATITPGVTTGENYDNKREYSTTGSEPFCTERV